jgi:RHS repeat-associated protein
MEYDQGSGLYHTHTRYYSPRLQRFLSEDPLGFGGGDTNLFAYTANDPVNEIDPSGLQVIVPGGYCAYGYAGPVVTVNSDSFGFAGLGGSPSFGDNVGGSLGIGGPVAAGGLGHLRAANGFGTTGQVGIDQGQIVLTQAERDEEEARRPGEEDNFGLPKPIAGVRGEPARWPANPDEYLFMRTVMSGRSVPKTDEIMEGRVNDPAFDARKGWKKMQQSIKNFRGKTITIHYFEQNADPSTRTQFHFTTKPDYYDPDFW